MDLLIPLALAALLIFFLFNSRRKQKARMEQIKSNLVPGATVMTTFGVFGTVVAIDEENNQVTIESGPGTTLRVHRQAIGQIDTPATAVPGAGDAAGSDAPGDAAEAPAITDAELDAMIERKRAEAESSDTADTAEGRGASSVDPDDSRTGAADLRDEDTAVVDPDPKADETPASDVKDTDSDDPGTGGPGTDPSDDGKKN